MFTPSGSIIGTMLLCTALGAGVAGQRPGPAGAAVDVTTRGPQVGEKVPDFTLTDQAGRPRSLASLMGEKGLVLSFQRSADW
ncbi:MAG: hypothetical protein H0X67_00225 [Acidobacteria bacterium]|nr:hypothetical protein [Acidobacteriota bacterium]